MCAQKGAVNLAQGLCHIECSPQKAIAIKAYQDALEEGKLLTGRNTYIAGQGLPKLLHQVASKEVSFNKLHQIDTTSPGRNVLITPGALGALNSALEAFLRPTEESNLV